MKKWLCFVLVCVAALSAAFPAAADMGRTILREDDFIRLVDRHETAPEGYRPVYHAGELQQIALDPSGKYMLMSDIDLSRSASVIQSLRDTHFSGVLDGNGFTISLGTLTETLHPDADFRLIALFHEINGGEIRNLKVSGEYVIDMDDELMRLAMAGATRDLFGLPDFGMDAVFSPYPIRIAGLAAGMTGASVLENCTSDVSVCFSPEAQSMLWPYYEDQLKTGLYIGGLVCTVVTEETDIRISSCRNLGNLEGPNLVGGIVGNAYGGTGKLILYACENRGNLYSRAGLGGILGRAWKLTERISCCANLGFLSGDNFVGGILGYHNSKDSQSRIEN